MSSTQAIPLLLPSVLTLSPLLLLPLLLVLVYFAPGGPSWALSSSSRLRGPSGFSAILAGSRPHRLLARLSRTLDCTPLMAFSVGLTRFIISSSPDTAGEILQGSAFADRPLKLSARGLLFERAMGFSPSGEHWYRLRRVAANHFFSPRKIQSFSQQRAAIGLEMLESIRNSMQKQGEVRVREVLNWVSLESMMRCVFGVGCGGSEVRRMVKEGYELLGEFNWGDHVPLLGWLDLNGVRGRCRKLADEVKLTVGGIIDEHRERKRRCGRDTTDGEDLVDVLLGMEHDMGLSQSDMIAVLWELIFRGTDTVAILLEWTLARLVLHPDIQRKAHAELDSVLGASRAVSYSDLPNLPYLQSIVKETLRLHPPGPLLSWARLAIHDTNVGGHHVPAGTTAMVNMWAITRDESIWPEAETFRPERFMEGEDISVMGGDLRLAPFGSGKRVCPGRALGMASTQLWLAQMLQAFQWKEGTAGVDLGECLKMSMEMETPLLCTAVPRI